MPLFSKKSDRRKAADGDKKKTQQPLPPPPEAPKPRPQPTFPIPHRHELVFHCQLAHGSSTREIKDFASVKDLYTRVAKAFEIEPEEIIFCTLNTHKVDMSRLLGGQIGLEDFIFAHVKGQRKAVSVTKTEMSLGLTITDNGAGYPFIKRIREGSPAAQVAEVLVGDHVEEINGRSLVGCRHYEVAKILKEIPMNATFSMSLVEPRKAFESIAPRGGVRSRPVSRILDDKSDALEAAVSKEEGRATLRLKNKGEAVMEKIQVWEELAVQRIDDLLESYMGIRDSDLAQAMVDASRGKQDGQSFALAMDSTLGEFEFPDDFIINVWSVIDSVKNSPHS